MKPLIAASVECIALRTDRARRQLRRLDVPDFLQNAAGSDDTWPPAPTNVLGRVWPLARRPSVHAARPGAPSVCGTRKWKRPTDKGWALNRGGQGQNRTADTRIFSPLLYQLSYLAVKSAHYSSNAGRVKHFGFIFLSLRRVHALSSADSSRRSARGRVRSRNSCRRTAESAASAVGRGGTGPGRAFPAPRGSD